MKNALAVLALILPQLAYAGGSSSVIIAVGYSPHGPAARLKLAADYVAVPISIQNDAKDPIKRSDEIEKALRTLTERLAPQSGLKIMSGVISLSPREQSKSYGSSDS